MAEPTKHLEPETEVPTYLFVFAALIVLTLLAVGSSFIPLGVGNAAVVLLIALCKTLLTLWFFMHVRHASRVMQLTIAAGVFTLGVLFVMTLADYVSRAWGSW
jgi:cytochrome c oxidase subunit 4